MSINLAQPFQFQVSIFKLTDLEQLGIFGMVTRKKGSLLWRHGLHVLTVSRPTTQSWFQQIRELCTKYQLPHPILLLREERPASRLNKLFKSKAT